MTQDIPKKLFPSVLGSGATVSTRSRSTLFLAGHETTAFALTYSLYLLARHPDCQARAADELRGILGGRAPAMGDLDSIAYTYAVLLESMRLYPPAWGIAREALTEVSIGGFAFPKGAAFVISPWVLHRDPKYFDEPESFKPERWQQNLAQRLPKFVYLPFGGGPRVCIGNQFAMWRRRPSSRSCCSDFASRSPPRPS